MPTLRQLFLMLGSNQDGEVVAAARAIGRQLAKLNKDWFWLADRLDGPDSQPGTKRPPPDDTDGDGDGDGHKAAAGWLLATCRQRLRPNELDFLENIREWRGDLTYRQAQWLSAICERYGYKGFRS